MAATSFTEGGPLTILRQAIDTLERALPADWDIVAIVHDAGLAPSRRARFIELPQIKKSWLRRLKFEWWDAARISRDLKPHLWLSLHDITPHVIAPRQAVYCHNPAPFFRIRWRDAYMEPKFLAFNLAYKLLYRINIRKNDLVIVQQDNLRHEFSRWIPADDIAVAYPEVIERRTEVRSTSSIGPKCFVYPAVPRSFKNMELIGEAIELLEKEGCWSSHVILTVAGTENRYARWLFKRFGHLKSLRFAGLQTKEQMHQIYEGAHSLLFPSRLETWGLPITEAKSHGLPMFVADLPYARETVGTYDAVDFIDTTAPQALARKLLAFQEGGFHFSSTVGHTPPPPFARNWSELISTLIEER